MRAPVVIPVAVTLLLSLGCEGRTPSDPSPVAPPVTTSGGTQSPTPPPDVLSGPIAFNDIGDEGAAVTSHSELGYTVQALSGSWLVGGNYGNPRPFIKIFAPGGTTATGEIQVTGGGATFSFTSVDLYSSTTPIPYTITGLYRSATVFATSGTVPNTFGLFRTVASPHPSARIDTLKISLANSAFPCCHNPMGLDNITLVK